MVPKLRSSILPVLLLTLAACSGGREEAPAPTEAPAAPSPISSREGDIAPPPDAAASGIDFALPAGWQSEPASGMRLAQASIPNTNGLGQLAVFYFGPGGGGGVDANIQRWIGQFDQPSGAAMKDSGRASFDVGNLKVSTVDVSGTYVAEVRPGATERHNKPNFRMRAAVVETPKGPYFIKLTGPAATVKAASPAFDQFLKALRF